jgi:UDP-N-acetylglucosamine 1-carboxyvinyltransferase
VGSLIGLAAVTRSEMEIEEADPAHLCGASQAFGKLGVRWEAEGRTIRIPSTQKLTVMPDLGGRIPKIVDAPWPGFPADLISIMVVVATQAEGTVLIHDWMFESRLFFVDKLLTMGARITLCDPHRVVVTGPAPLAGMELVSPDVRAGMALLTAALCARGRSTIQNIYQIERGYECITERLQALGARIARSG